MSHERFRTSNPFIITPRNKKPHTRSVQTTFALHLRESEEMGIPGLVLSAGVDSLPTQLPIQKAYQPVLLQLVRKSGSFRKWLVFRC